MLYRFPGFSALVSGSFFCVLLLLAGQRSSGQARPAEIYPSAGRFLFWSPQEKPFGFRNIEKIFPGGHTVKRGPNVSPLPYAPVELAIRYQHKGQAWTTARFMQENDVAGLLVIHEGKILLERYALGFDQNSRWTSFSVAKSFTSTLAGAAIADGSIASIDDPVTKYLPGLKGSAYEGVTVRHILTMSSGVKWNEDYVDRRSDLNSFPGTDESRGSRLVTYMSKLPREAEPGTEFVYKTGETNLLGELVMAATKKPLADYLSEKIWSKIGMEQDAYWMTSGGNEMGGCCLSASLRDYGRFALFFLNGAKPVVAPEWTSQSTTAAPFRKVGGDPVIVEILKRGGYGYQWWIGPGNTFFATGIFGQHIQFFPSEKLLVVSLSAWPAWTDAGRWDAREAYLQAVRSAVNH